MHNHMMFPQHYKAIVKRCARMFFAGTALQLFIGEVPSTLLTHPWGAVLAINYLYIVILLSFYKERWKWVTSFTGRPSYIASLASMLVLTLIFGLIPQDGATTGVLGVLGLTDMKSSWIFNIFLLHFTTLTGVKAIDDIRNIKKGRLPSKIIHAAFFTILTAAIFGSGDKTKIDITAIQGYPVGIGIDDKGARAELPFSIRLKEFTLDEYPPQIKIISSGTPSKEYMTIEGEKSNGKIGKWQIECARYIDMAGRKPNDSAYIEMNHVGATSAAYIKATDGKLSAEGWVSCGSHIFPAASLPLANGDELIMPRREIKKFLSKIEIERDGEKQTYDIAVNKPAKIGAWRIYQSGYDNSRGKWSTTSILQCVKDGWYGIVQTAMWLVLAAGIMMFIMGTRRKE